MEFILDFVFSEKVSVPRSNQYKVMNENNHGVHRVLLSRIKQTERVIYTTKSREWLSLSNRIVSLFEHCLH